MEQYNENQEKVLGFLMEVGACKQELPYRDALIRLKEYLSVKAPKNSFRLSFGKFAIAAKDYMVLNDKQIENVRKCLKKARGCKLYVRCMPTLKLYKKEFFAFGEPGQVLWEMDGIDETTAAALVCEVAEITGEQLELLRA